MPDGYEVQNALTGRQLQNRCNAVVVERPDGDRAEVQGGRLEQNILGDVSGFHEAIAFGARPVLDGGPLHHCDDDEAGRGLADRFLVQGGCAERESDIAGGMWLQ